MSCSKCLRCLALVALAIASCSAQSLVGGQEGSSYPGSCPVDKWNDVVVTVVATLPESTTGPVSVSPMPFPILRGVLSIAKAQIC